MPTNFNPGTKGTGFVGLQDYLDANQNAVNSTAQTLGAGAENAGFQAQGEDQALGSEAFNTAHDGVGNAVQNGSTDSQSDPTTLPDYEKAQTDSQNADNTFQGLGSFGTDAAQLRNTYGNSSTPYSQGDNELDANLLSGSGSAQATLKGAQTGVLGQLHGQYAGLDDYLNGTSNAQSAAGTDAGVQQYGDPNAPQAPAQPVDSTTQAQKDKQKVVSDQFNPGSWFGSSQAGTDLGNYLGDLPKTPAKTGSVDIGNTGGVYNDTEGMKPPKDRNSGGGGPVGGGADTGGGYAGDGFGGGTDPSTGSNSDGGYNPYDPSNYDPSGTPQPYDPAGSQNLPKNPSSGTYDWSNPTQGNPWDTGSGGAGGGVISNEPPAPSSTTADDPAGPAPSGYPTGNPGTNRISPAGGPVTPGAPGSTDLNPPATADKPFPWQTLVPGGPLIHWIGQRQGWWK